MKVEFYTLPNGRQPAREYILSLDEGLRSKTMRTIGMLRQYGHMIGEPELKHLEGGIFELRTTMGNNSSRVLYFFVTGGKAVLTHGFSKKTKKTPRREIEKAKSYRTDYSRRVGGDDNG